MCVFVNRTPFQPVCSNHEVVVFQPQIGTATYIGSIDTVKKNYSIPSCPICLNRFWMFLYSLLLLPSFPPAAISLCNNLMYALPTSSLGVERRSPRYRPHPPPDSLSYSSLCPSPYACVCRRFLCPENNMTNHLFTPIFMLCRKIDNIIRLTNYHLSPTNKLLADFILK